MRHATSAALPASPQCVRRACSAPATACVQYVDPVTGRPGSLHDVCAEHAAHLVDYDCYILVGVGARS